MVLNSDAHANLHDFWEAFGNYLLHTTVVFIVAVSENASSDTPASRFELLNKSVLPVGRPHLIHDRHTLGHSMTSRMDSLTKPLELPRIYAARYLISRSS